MYKQCYTCNEYKEHSEFNKDKQKIDGLNSNCKKCSRIKNRNHQLKYKKNNKSKLKDQKTKWNCKNTYGITFEEYQTRIATSDKCEICGKKEDLCYDHDHDTLEFRGVLCRGCNRSIGQLGDTKESILKVLEYFNK